MRPEIKASHACFGEALGAALPVPQVVPPGKRHAGDVERQEDLQRQVGSAGGGNRGAEAAWDQVSATGSNRRCEAEHRGTLDTGRLEGQRPGRVAQALCLPELLGAEDRGDHPESRAVADAGRDEEDKEHDEEPRKALDLDVMHDADGRGAHDDEVPEGHARRPPYRRAGRRADARRIRHYL